MESHEFFLGLGVEPEDVREVAVDHFLFDVFFVSGGLLLVGRDLLPDVVGGAGVFILVVQVDLLAFQILAVQLRWHWKLRLLSMVRYACQLVVARYYI